MSHLDLLAQAEECEKKNDWKLAIEVYKQLFDQTPNPEMISKLAWCYSRNGDYEAARIECSKLIQKEPENSKWLYMMGYQFYMQGKWKEATEYFERALEYYPEYFVVLYRIAYSYLQIAGEYLKLTKSEYWKAIGYLNNAHQIWGTYSKDTKEKEAKTYYQINFLHGKALMQIPTHNNAAIGFFKQALLIHNDPDCSYNLAKAFFYDKQFKQAKAVLPDSQKFYVLELLANIEYELGNYEKAFSTVLGLLKKKQKDYLLCLAAAIKIKTKDLYEAYSYAIKAISVNKGNHKCYMVLANVYYCFGLMKKTLETLDIAEQTKMRKYGARYLECETLREQITARLSPDYVEDKQVLASLENTQRPLSTGVLVHYNESRGFGFVYVNGQRIFVHASQSRNGELINGTKIQFITEQTDKGLQAVNVEIIKG